ncbi:Flp pilus assembly complex ATPase component TadA [Permianibacter sp. IMCC34836]|uniref:GspE/PulE family protein n=1 Tax=Permianibacter fluminis TaxID=2738515 RepID=UPI001554F1CB|nr:GspE/PulE family protein [Permianibacter fluminis]NQD35911.1 Flp pilus assembly complex ATPase component TadA [Permianibacter fluminis]
MNAVPNPPIPVIQNMAALREYLLLYRGRHHWRLGEYLVSTGQLHHDHVEHALSEQRQRPSEKLGEILVRHNQLSAESLKHALYTLMGVPTIDLDNLPLQSDALQRLPATVTRRLELLPVLLDGDELVVACHRLPSPEEIAEVEFAARMPVHFVLTAAGPLRDALFRHYEAVLEQDNNGFSTENGAPVTLSLEEERQANRPPIIQLGNSILQDAIDQRASDIHLRPERDSVELIYRVDGSMVPVQQLKRALLSAVVSRLKILAKLNIAEHRVPQDGHIQVMYQKQSIDFRLSIIPTVWGESVVLRILNKQQGLRTLAQIGLDPKDQETLQNLLVRGSGILLVTGPTGSGKTTTLYAALQEIAKRALNIITVEDPVEYELPGMRQIQLLDAIGFGFPRTLRHILRHDPDVIMIGEMRDEETCRIALESALTGHLVLSTLHTNDAPGAIIRLKEMGMSPYLIRSSVIGVLAQRLVRINCPHCRQPENVSPSLRALFGFADNEVFYAGAGCRHCHHTGFAGRKAIYELFELTEAVQTRLNKILSATELRALALEAGMRPMFQHGLSFARTGELSLLELYGACY